MKQYLFIGGGILVLVFITLLLLTPKAEETSAPQVNIDMGTLPVIATLEGSVFITKDGRERAAIIDERIAAPFELRSEASSSATVRLPNDSELRLDADSNLSITEASYSLENQGLIVRAKLSIGKVWSNITNLATPESAWEVETSNVVATVRGTAFGMEATETGATTITGSEHTIELTLIDPDTGLRDTDRSLALLEDEFITIGDALAKADTWAPPTPEKRTDEQDNDSWVKQNEDRDDAVQLELDLPNDEVTPSDTAAEISTPPVQTIESTVSETAPVEPRTSPVQTTPTISTPTPTPVSLAITSATSLTGISEGMSVPFKATLNYDTGATKDVTSEVTWSVIGKIGSMRSNVFIPLLDPTVREFGKSSGSISAIWKNSTTNDQLLGTSPIFEVKANFTPLNTTSG